MSTPSSGGLDAESPESGDTDTTSLYGNPSGEPADEGGDIETNQTTEEELMSADEDPLPDQDVSDPSSTPQGPLR
jgi:hypothetical protein